MGVKCTVRIIRIELHDIKNVKYGNIPFMNYDNVNRRAVLEDGDIIGVYGPNGSGKTALVESMDMLKRLLCGNEIPYDVYGGIFHSDNEAYIQTEFFILREKQPLKVRYTAFLHANPNTEKISVYRESLGYWQRGAGWKAERILTFDNAYSRGDDILLDKDLTVDSPQIEKLSQITVLKSMDKLAIACAQSGMSVFFNRFMLSAIRPFLRKGQEETEAGVFGTVIAGLMQFGVVDINVVKVQQLGAINHNFVIPINIHRETEDKIYQECICLKMAEPTVINMAAYSIVRNTVDSINIALRAIIPGLQLELDEQEDLKKPDGVKAKKVEVYAKRAGQRFLLRYESDGIRRIISILNYLIAVVNNPGVCLVVDELDSGIFEYLLGEMLGVMYRDIRGQLIFTSHNLRILEKLPSKNIVYTTVTPTNRYIRLIGVEKNHNRRDFYIRAINVGGQKEPLYDETDLIGMAYAFRKAGKQDYNRG